MPDDLIVLASCQNCKAAIDGVIAQHLRLGIRRITPSIFIHPAHDPGCVTTAASILRSQQNLYSFAMVICDREGCGREHLDAPALEAAIEADLAANGWAGRSAAVVIDPELEAWVWSDSPHVATVLGWKLLTPKMTEWMQSKGLLSQGNPKPPRPKESVGAVMEFSRKRKTSAIFGQLAALVSFQRCQDRAFRKFCTTLRQWFPQENLADQLDTFRTQLEDEENGC